MTDNICSVKVSVRIRPLIKSELYKSQECVTCDEYKNLIYFNNDKQYEFDHVYGKNSNQQQLYADTTIPLLEQF